MIIVLTIGYFHFLIFYHALNTNFYIKMFGTNKIQNCIFYTIFETSVSDYISYF